VNAGCAEKDITHIKKQLHQAQENKMDVKFEQIDRSLIALQGPKAEKVLSSLATHNFDQMGFMTSVYMKVGGFDCLVSRCGYTGEDGFEISVAHKDAIPLAKKMLAYSEVKAAGLGPRDSLRLEAGLCLYGHDISDAITPVEGKFFFMPNPNLKSISSCSVLDHRQGSTRKWRFPWRQNHSRPTQRPFFDPSKASWFFD
jgi:aminomethyltransferase